MAKRLSEADLGGTFQARFERNAFDEALLKRLADLEKIRIGQIIVLDQILQVNVKLPHSQSPEGIPGLHRIFHNLIRLSGLWLLGGVDFPGGLIENGGKAPFVHRDTGPLPHKPVAVDI